MSAVANDEQFQRFDGASTSVFRARFVPTGEQTVERRPSPDRPYFLICFRVHAPWKRSKSHGSEEIRKVWGLAPWITEICSRISPWYTICRLLTSKGVSGVPFQGNRFGLWGQNESIPLFLCFSFHSNNYVRIPGQIVMIFSNANVIKIL